MIKRRFNGAANSQSSSFTNPVNKNVYFFGLFQFGSASHFLVWLFVYFLCSVVCLFVFFHLKYESLKKDRRNLEN